MFPHHVAVYGDRVVSMDYIGDKKREFSSACMRCVDNAGAGWVVCPSGEVFAVCRSYRRARRLSGDEAGEVLARVRSVLSEC